MEIIKIIGKGSSMTVRMTREQVKAYRELQKTQDTSQMEVFEILKQGEQNSAAFRLKKHHDAQQTQINWDSEDLYERNEAIASDPATSELQREAGYDPNPDNGVTFVEKTNYRLRADHFLRRADDRPC